MYIYHRRTSLEKKALEDVSLQIERGECVGIIGQTGSGKTTIGRHFNGLLKPFYGKVVIEGINLSSSGKSWTEVRQRVALMSQYLEQQLILDEPTVELDGPGKHESVKHFERLHHSGIYRHQKRQSHDDPASSRLGLNQFKCLQYP